MSKIAIYVRVSTEAQVREGFSLDAQKQKGIEKAKDLDLDYDIFEEKGQSASSEKIEDRPILNKLIDLCDKGIYKYVFVTELDRLSRNELVSALIKKIFRDNSVIVYTLNQKIDYSNYEDEFISGLLTLLSRRENKVRVARSERAKIKAIEKGKWKGGILPFGYTTDKNNNLIIDDEEAKIYLKMVDMSLKHFGTNKIADWLNEENILTGGQKSYRHKKELTLKDRYTGKEYKKPIELLRWTQPVILGILKNPIYKGELRYKGNLYKAPAIIDEFSWDRIQNNFEKNKILNRRKNKRIYLLRGLLYCSKCGSRLYGLIKEARGMRQYTCLSKRTGSEIPNCGLRSINLDKIENIIWEYVSSIISEDGVWNIEETQLEDRKELEKIIVNQNKKIKEFDQEKERVLQLFVKNKIDEAQYDEYINRIGEQIKELKKNIDGVKEKIRRNLEMEEYLKKYSMRKFKFDMLQKYNDKEKRELIEYIIDRVEIDFDKEKFDHYIYIKSNKLSRLSMNSGFYLKDKDRVFYNLFTPVEYEDKIIAKLKKEMAKEVLRKE